MDSGAALFVCNYGHADDYPLLQIQGEGPDIRAANDNKIEKYGRRHVLYELVEGFYFWASYLVCDVNGPIWSIKELRDKGYTTRFDPTDLALYIHDNRIEFQDMRGSFMLQPLRVVPFEEIKQNNYCFPHKYMTT